MGCTASSAAVSAADAPVKVGKKAGMKDRQDSDASSASNQSAASAGVKQGRRLSMTGGPAGNSAIDPKTDAKRRRLSISSHPRQSVEEVKAANRRDSLPGPKDEVRGPPEGTQATHLPVTFGVLSRPGNDPMKRVKENQDSFVVHDQFGDQEDQMFFGVWDGHGPNGAFASQYVRDNLPAAMLSADLHKDPFEAINKACISTNAELTVSAAVDVYVSGSTSITGVLRGRKLYIANVGDSRAVLGRTNKRGAVKALDLSNDQKPDRDDEKARIIASGGRVFEWGVPRVWLQDMDIPGLAMSRSFGDLAAETVGVFAEPEMSEANLSHRDKFAIWASDGVWEFISSQEAVDLVSTYLDKSPQEACEALVKESTKRWQEEEDVVDDTTCIIAFFNFPE